MVRSLGACALGLAGVLMACGAAAPADAGQGTGDRPAIELGARVAALAEPNHPGVGGSPQVTWNLDQRTAIEGSADVRQAARTSFMTVRSQLVYVQLKRTLHTSGTGRFFATMGGAGGRERRTYPGFTYPSPSGPVTYPDRTNVKGIGGLSLGIGYDRMLGSHVAFDVQTQFVLTQDQPVVRTLLGASFPAGRFHRKPDEAAPVPATFSQVDVGQTAWVTMADGRLWHGTITSLSTTALGLTRAGVPTLLPIADVRRIEAPDRITDGASRGAAIGLTTGVPVLIGDLAICRNEGGDCAGWALANAAIWSGLGAGMGAVIGAIADSLHEGRRVVYEAGTRSLGIAPIVSRRGAGVGAVIRW